MEAMRLKMEPWRVCRPVVADLYHFGETRSGPIDPDPHHSEQSDPDPHQSIYRGIQIRILIIVFWILNTGFNWKFWRIFDKMDGIMKYLPGDHLWFSCLLLMLEYLIFYAGKLSGFSLQCLCFPRRNDSSSCNSYFLEFFSEKFTGNWSFQRKILWRSPPYNNALPVRIHANIQK